MIYLDHSATTALDEVVFSKINQAAKDLRYNPSAVYKQAQKALSYHIAARRTIARILDVDDETIFFTSGATESNNLVLKGLAFKNLASHKKTILLTAAEHSSVLETANFLESYFGFTVRFIPINKDGIIDIKAFKNMLDKSILLVAVSFASSEIGTLQPIDTLSEICTQKDIFFHVDAAQAPNFYNINPEKWGVSSLSLSAHKIYGPNAVGLIYLKKGLEILPLVHGGKQEKGLRAGTENVIGVTGFAEALSLCANEQEISKVSQLTLDLRNKLIEKFPHIIFTGHPSLRLPFHISMIVPGISSHRLLIKLDINGIAASAGSACNLGHVNPSQLLLALGYSKKQAGSSLRLTLGRSNNAEHVSEFIKIFEHIIKED